MRPNYPVSGYQVAYKSSVWSLLIVILFLTGLTLCDLRPHATCRRSPSGTFCFVHSSWDLPFGIFPSRDSCIAQQSSGKSAVRRQIPCRANPPSLILLVLSGTTRGQQHKNLNPQPSWTGPAGTGGASLTSVRTIKWEMPSSALSGIPTEEPRPQGRSLS